MGIIVSLLCAAAFVAVFRKPIMRFPVVFYGIAVLLDALLVLGHSYALPVFLWKYLLVFMQRCLFAQALLIIVMFVGVLSEKSRLRSLVLPIRGELSIIAALLVLGHALTYLNSYFIRVTSNQFAIPAGLMVAFSISLILLILLALLTITSFRTVKTRMTPEHWKRVQWLAYPFFGLIYVHLVSALLQPALSGAKVAISSIGAYTLIYLAYFILRVRKAVIASRLSTRASESCQVAAGTSDTPCMNRTIESVANHESGV
ncbi:MAG: hypothetical protein AB2L09_09695 [Coriobacteriia bacterium]